MLGLLARVVIGVVAAGAVGAATYGVYKILTPDQAKEDINEVISNNDKYQDAFKAVLKNKMDNNDIFSFDVLDKWDDPLGEVEVPGDETTMEVGEEIILRDA